MIKNYILVTLRQFTRHKLFSGLNIFCLSIGVNFCLLNGQYVLREKEVNAGLKNIHQQYFLKSQWKIENTGPDITTVGPGIATGLMGLIVLLGIFGVWTLALSKRKKEIAVTKVLGAEVYHIITLFLKQYAILVGIAILIAWPLAYLLTSRWLEQICLPG